MREFVRGNTPKTQLPIAAIYGNFEEQNQYVADSCTQYSYDECYTTRPALFHRTETRISPLIIDEEFNIILPLYPNVKVSMPPLQKAVYLLLLMHPEGILIKEISNHKEEFREIYCTVSGRKNSSVIKRVTEKMMNPTENLIHKSISMIKHAFLCQMTNRDAKYYMPDTGRSKAHRIPLDSKMIYTKHRFNNHKN